MGRGRGRAVSLLVVSVVTLATSVPAISGVTGDIDSLTLRQKVGQLVMFSVAGRSLTSSERDAIKRLHLGGVILFSKNYASRTQLDALTTQIQRAARRGNPLGLGALISVDQEGGVVKRFPDMPPRYSHPQLGEINRKSLAFDQGRATGWALGHHGVNVNLAPVADLDLPPSHVMRERSFGWGRYRVARLANSFARGLQSRRVAATAKHFPGFGGATINSDFGRAYIHRSRRRLRRVDAVPFHRVISGGIRMIMLSHGMYVNDGGRVPASMSRYIATKRLRKEFGFKGVAISDALESVNWRFGGSTAKACKQTIRAGVDIALIVGGIGTARACSWHIRKGVREGDISKARLHYALRRVLELKEWLGLYNPG